VRRCGAARCVTLPPILTVYLSLASPIVLLGPVVTDADGHASLRFMVPGQLPPYGASVQWVFLGECAPWTTSDALRL
jgi:hypothetical protein